ncbi:MAG: hypothetical protein A3C27_00750 [Candidatus Levybacteria bacterium RIFCSPHIGHO2_02_FULL_39_36]|nr:MAG: hypothetical protein UT20_C0030G0007 [Candidatus Levybacteria bacterium GW2011_GWA1_39_11]KKR25354.1 MAG: hypothetical protein UT56_C0001G0085 [Candidatus Levybacteria bacterium GW2011_GWB1_39_7]KKR50399.1 MAG: hypothetical protein UT85_C0002G0007 [Candidatus Levybacteria bacterium GW2011_GWA2_40_16]OGH15453.1 MAG: hypothetical protein A2689_00835 [Candidatus Levybacteria bacterium RIFCSPHIGHO2_01_FULL_38_96]OGH25519.1 MAG: hypothetical protein A3E68_02480 [Candidatus Levybacteria bacte
MAAELDQLRRQADQLAKQFKQKGYPDLADTLSADAKSYGARAKIARKLGMPEHFSSPTAPVPLETPTVIEQLTIRESFTDVEREALIADGALIYTPLGETITAQKDSRAKKGKPSFAYLTTSENRLVAVPSRKVEIAIYPAPERAFVPDSFSKGVEGQDKAVAVDAVELRQRLGQEGLGQIIPGEASTVTDIVFQHEEATGQWLLGSEYAAAQGLNYVYTRTKNPTNSTGSDVAYVGDAGPGYGVFVDHWGRGSGRRDIGVLRMVVPIETK